MPHSGAITQLGSGRAGRGLGAGCEARGAAGGEVSDSGIEAFPSAIALSKQCQQGARWGQAEIRKGSAFRREMSGERLRSAKTGGTQFT